MAPSRNPPPRSNPGIISNVVGYLGREYDRFIATATGTSLPEDPPSEGESSHDDEDLVDLSSPLKKSPVRTGRAPASSPVRTHKAQRGHYPSLPEEDVLTSPNPTSSSQGVQSHEQTPEPSQSTSSSTSDAFHGRRQRRMSITMPGSLFPRSGSLEPDSTPANLDSETPRHVQWAATPLEVSRKYRSSRDLSIAGSSRLPIPYDAADLDLAGVPPVQDSPLGRRGVKSVKDAVSHFAVGDENVDASIMLPNPTTSPSRVAVPSPERLSPGSKGKGRAIDTSPAKATASLGDDDPFLDVESDSSGVLRARAKQKELDVAREVFARGGDLAVEDTDQRDQDKLKIQLLEQEVRRLTAELAKHANSTELSSGDLQMTPAPPAPPPPPPTSTYSTPIPYRQSGAGAGRDGLLANVRASLRHAGTPYEAPINDPLLGAGGARVRHRGQPTVPLTNNDDMASFLKELKVAKLKPVGETSMALDASTSGSAPPRANTLTRRVTLEDLKRQRALDAERSRSAVHSRSHVDRGNLTVGDLQPRPSSSRMPLRANMTVDAISISPPVPVPSSQGKGKGKEVSMEGRVRASTVSTESTASTSADSIHVQPAEATIGEKRKRLDDDVVDTSQRRRNFTGLQPPIRKAGSKAVHKPARVIPTVATTARVQSKPPPPSNIPRETAPRLYPMPPKIIPATSTSTLPPSSVTDPTPSLTSDNEGSPKDDRYTDPLTTPPKAIPHLDLSKIGFHTGIKTKSPPMQSTIPRQVRGKPPSTMSDAFATRPPQSPLIIDTPRRPLPPARQSRRSSGGSAFTPDNVGEDDQYQLPIPPAEKQTRRTSQSQSSKQLHRRPSPLPALHLGTFPTQNAPAREDSARRVRRPPTPPRQRTSSTFADELMRLSSPSFDGDGDEYEIDIDSGVLVSMGTKSKRRGFLAHGGAGGPSVFLGKGYVEGALDSDEEAMEEDRQAQASFDRIARRMSTSTS